MISLVVYHLISKNGIFSFNPERKKQFYEFESFGQSNGSCFTSIAFYANGIFTIDVQNSMHINGRISSKSKMQNQRFSNRTCNYFKMHTNVSL